MADNVSLTKTREIQLQVDDQAKEHSTSVRRESTSPNPRYRNIVHLWEFILELLAYGHESYSIIAWIRQDRGEFMLKNPEEVAKLWGAYKNVQGMTYSKLSRALRHYYQKGIIKKVAGHRLTYKFDKLPYKYEPGVTRFRYYGCRLNECIQKQLRKKEFAPFQIINNGHSSSACVHFSTPLRKRCFCRTQPTTPRPVMWFPCPLSSLSPFSKIMFRTAADPVNPLVFPPRFNPCIQPPPPPPQQQQQQINVASFLPENVVFKPFSSPCRYL